MKEKSIVRSLDGFRRCTCADGKWIPDAIVATDPTASRSVQMNEASVARVMNLALIIVVAEIRQRGIGDVGIGHGWDTDTSKS